MTVIRLFRFLALACVLAVPTVAASTLIVEVVDPTGAAVPAADVMLETPAGAVVDEAETTPKAAPLLPRLGPASTAPVCSPRASRLSSAARQ